MNLRPRPAAPMIPATIIAETENITITMTETKIITATETNIITEMKATITTMRATLTIRNITTSITRSAMTSPQMTRHIIVVTLSM